MIKAAIIGLGWWGSDPSQDPVEQHGHQAGAGRRSAWIPRARPPLGARRRDRAAFRGRAWRIPTIKAVILCTPQQHHAEQIVAAAQSGRHVFCEKPLCTTAADAEAAIAAVRKAGVQLGIGHERRFEPAVIDMRKRFAAGEFGTSAAAGRQFQPGQVPEHCRATTGGCRTRKIPPARCPPPASIWSTFPSRCSAARCSVWARLATLGSDFANGDTLSMTIGFESGATAMLGAVLATPFMGRLALLGSKGWMEIRDRSHPENSTGWDVTSVHRDENAGDRFPSAASGGARQSGGFWPRSAWARALPGHAG